MALPTLHKYFKHHQHAAKLPAMVAMATMFLSAIHALHAANVADRPQTGPTSQGVSKLIKPKSREHKSTCPAHFITALLIGPRGGLWVAGEDTGIYHRKAHSRHWHHFNTSNSPGLVSNHIYSLCIDHQGRLWAGTLRHGVCIYNGKKWRHYGIVTGPLGSHVMAIANDPRDKSVWMGTENGISIYRTGHQSWRYVAGMNGLPANPDCIAFNKRGTAFVGTLCNGLAISRYPYKHWRVITGPWHTPRTPFGDGLPSNLVNCVLIGIHQTVYVGTDLGLAISRDGGQSFRYERGRDYAAKVKGLWHPPTGFAMPSQKILSHLLPGDHITSLAQGPSGNLWLGTWRDGYAKINIRNGAILQSRLTPGLSKLDGYIAQLATMANGTLAIGRYGFGVSTLKYPEPNLSKNLAKDTITRHNRKILATHLRIARPLVNNPLPAPAKPPGKWQLWHIANDLKRQSSSPLHAAYLGSDWTTQGDWVGRYGRQYAVLYACDEPLNEYVCFSGSYYHLHQAIGPHHLSKDVLRAWLQWPSSRDSRVLYDPVIGHRCEAELDDHGETLPTTWQDLGIWISVRVLAHGVQRISLYFFNKDGHGGPDRQRDYVVDMYHGSMGIAAALKLQPLATARVSNFWGSVYESFVVAGPGNYLIRIRRNGSLNTILQGAFIDRLSGPSIPSDSLGLSFLPHIEYGVPNLTTIPESILIKNPAMNAAVSLDSTVRGRIGERCYPAFVRVAQVMALRVGKADRAPSAMAKRLRWELHIWNRTDRKKFSEVCEKGWKNFLAENPNLHGKPPH